VPSARVLAKELGLARGTIDEAYSLLVAEGYLETRGQAGTVVAVNLRPGSALPMIAAPPAETILLDRYRADSILPFQMGLPALDAFPRKLWSSLGTRCVRGLGPSGMAQPPVSGAWPLRAEIAAYLRVSRGIDCMPSQIFITSGYRNSLDLIGRALLKRGDQVWMEDPGFPPTRELLQEMELIPVSVRVDADGIDVTQGLLQARHARAAVVTPAHQSPLCMSLSLSRRLALLDWAVQSDAWVIEDDYDGEYRYTSRPLPALKNLDRFQRVLYAGTFSKVLFPSIRLAYLVVPVGQTERFNEVSQVVSAGSPELTQAIVATFMSEGHFARHIHRMRKLYAERRKATAAGVQAVLGKHVRIDLQPGGMHLVLRLDSRQSDRDIVGRMRSSGLYAEALTEWAGSNACAPGLLVNFTNIESAQAAAALAERMLPLFASSGG
jgi:GntR family transcriptional regulator/MocR family aminotransferase